MGYAHMTMEGVAVRAKTNKATVYRRWPSKSLLIVAALHKHVPRPTEDVPNTGDLRDDILTLMRRITTPMQIVGAETIHGLLLEHLGKDIITSFPRLRNSNIDEKWNTIIMTILKNAEKRGELNADKISTRIVSLPFDLIRYEFLVTQVPISDETLMEIIDTIFLPLVRSKI
ncbi:TetR/AcrR family transcriptional regulator [Clostridium aminobutyricum]|uniref:TetR/AcrR family transcriptional regulator n=2 Tax=Clostridium aminobutyricum TaxID=33953 RepID=A0A939D757_CLOAM|nr:TetR/AcrR family transcriptional regulator [Clostridium aminobutyricum]